MVRFLQQPFLWLTLPLLATTLPLSHTLYICLSVVLLFPTLFPFHINIRSVFVSGIIWINIFRKELFSFQRVTWIQNITLGLKGLLLTNTLAYWTHPQVTKKTKFCEYSPSCVSHIHNTSFSLLLKNETNKLECLSSESLSKLV